MKNFKKLKHRRLPPAREPKADWCKGAGAKLSAPTEELDRKHGRGSPLKYEVNQTASYLHKHKVRCGSCGRRLQLRIQVLGSYHPEVWYLTVPRHKEK